VTGHSRPCADIAFVCGAIWAADQQWLVFRLDIPNIRACVETAFS
jgi:hypothetical protein